MIVEYKETYLEAAKELLESSSYYLPVGEKAQVTLLVIENEEVIGVGSLWENSVHPHREYIGLSIQESKRRKGIGQELYCQLIARSKKQQFQTSVFSKDESAVSFLRKNGFQCARKCYEPTLKDKAKDEAIQLPVISYSQATEEQKQELLNLQRKNYEHSHASVNPLNPALSSKSWKQIVLEDLDERHSFLLVENEKIVAYILNYAGAEGEIEIGFIGGRDAKMIAEYLPFYKKSINQLIETFPIVSMEADDIDPFAFAALNCFDYDKTDSWDAYIYQ